VSFSPPLPFSLSLPPPPFFFPWSRASRALLAHVPRPSRATALAHAPRAPVGPCGRTRAPSRGRARAAPASPPRPRALPPPRALASPSPPRREPPWPRARGPLPALARASHSAPAARPLPARPRLAEPAPSRAPAPRPCPGGCALVVHPGGRACPRALASHAPAQFACLRHA
jgi:hypothetical protein